MNLERVQELHAQALALAAGERAAFLDEACGGDAELRAEVESLLAARESMHGFLERPAAQAVVPKTLPPGSRVGGYEIVRVLGAGGAGTVYEALQKSPRRRVALKMLRSRFGSETAQRRFRDEAEILARLKHPSIATIYEAGVHGDLPWFAMEHVDGARDVVRHAAPLDRRRRLALFASVCDAVHHGHQRGIIHRDLKPANVLVDETGRPKVIDFGIARIAGATEAPELAGTPAYMSPEQCEPGQENVDVRSDVYALGVLFHELLTGRVPRDVDGLPIAEAARQIREDPLPPLALKGDLGAIARRALAKDREHRYASAAALADDVRRHLEDRPVEARAGGVLYQLRKFVRRERLASLVLVAFGLVLVAAAVISRRQARESELRAYVANVAAASAALRANDVGDARQRLELAPEHLRGWEWHHFRRRLDVSEETLVAPRGQLYAGAISGDGEVVAGAGWKGDYWVAVWDRTRRRRRVLQWDDCMAHAVALDSSGTRLAIAFGNGVVEIRDVPTLEVERTLQAHETIINAITFDPEDRRLATAANDGFVKLWDTDDGALLHALPAHADRVITVAFDASGSRLASGGREGTLRVWEADSGGLLLDLDAHAGSVEGVAWSPLGGRLASVSRDRTLRLWDAETGVLVATGRGPDHNIRAVAFSPDGETVATACFDYTTRLWNASNAEEIACLRGHTDSVRAVVFEPDGGRLATFSADGTVRFWAATERGGVPALLGHTDWVSSLAFGGDGGLLASGSRDGTVRLWDPARRRPVATLATGLGHVTLARLWPDGSRLLVLSATGARTLAVPGGEVLARTDPCQGAALGPETYLARADRILAGDRAWRAHDGMIACLAYCARSGLLASASVGGTVRLWRPEAAELARGRRVHEGSVHALDFSPGGGLLAVTAGDRIRVLDGRTLAERATLAGHTGEVRAVAFSPDGSRLASAGDDRTVRLWDVETWVEVAVLHGHRYAVRSVAFSADGRRLASAGGAKEGRDTAILLWER